jgi:hypothetical protein
MKHEVGGWWERVIESLEEVFALMTSYKEETVPVPLSLPLATLGVEVYALKP